MDSILSEKEIAALNAARSILATFANKCVTASWDAPRLEHGKANPADYGRAAALADSAERGIFACLNAANAHDVRQMTDAQLHNHDEEHTGDSIIPPALVAVGHEDYPEARE